MGSRSRAAWLCKSYLLVSSLEPSAITRTQLRFKSTAANSRFHRMATEASTSSPTPTDGDNGSHSSGNDSATSSSASSAVDFLSLCHRLKTTKRAGWVKRDVKEPESIADHMYRMGLMALIAPDMPGIDRDKCVKMAIVHDIAEAIVGDITPADGISKAEKSRQEQEALDHMCKLLGAGSQAKEIWQIWMEYEENASPEAKLVKDFDKGKSRLK
uniref:Catalytic n=1 Tax=Rhizophora mucronata TaxID=61149 RepID=A0A2P2JKF0_RHIMU